MILVIGSINTDLAFHSERFPEKGETLEGNIYRGLGGKGANQAIAASRSGAKTSFIGAVGSDPFGSEAKQILSKEGVKNTLSTKKEAPTGSAGIFVDQNGENKIICALGANRLLEPEDIPEELFEQAKVILFQFESNRRTSASLLEKAKKSGIRTILNTAPMNVGDVRSSVELADIIIANETEFSELLKQFQPAGLGDFTGEQIHSLSDQKLHELCRACLKNDLILTLGARGCFISEESGRYKFIGARTNIKVVDTTGAGDAFVGGTAAGLLRFDGDLIKAAAFGNVVAALSTTKIGASQSMPYKSDIARYLNPKD